MPTKKNKVIISGVEVTKVTRRSGETFQECVSRGIPELIEEGMSPDQAVAAANSMCRLKSKKEKNFWSNILKIRR